MLDGSAIYCDDLRTEISGKNIIVGMYNTDLIAGGKFPFSIPQIVVLLKIRASTDFCGRQITLRVIFPHMNEERLHEEFVDLPDMPGKELLEQIQFAYEDGPVFMNFVRAVTLNDLNISKLSFIKAELECGDCHKRLEPLRISSSNDGIDTLQSKIDWRQPSEDV